VRIALLACLVGLVAGIPASAAPAAIAPSLYTVQPDPRLCPSPRCGGYWVTLANSKQTRCADGVLRPRCYAARVLDEERHALASGVPAGAIVRGDLEPWRLGDFGNLESLVVRTIWSPVGRAPTTSTLYRLRDSRIRCVKAPCYWLRVLRLNSTSRTTASDLDLAPAGATPSERERAEAALRSPNGLFATGRMVPAADGGRLFHATRIFLRSKLPRA
jgi:hypothetical protein